MKQAMKPPIPLILVLALTAGACGPLQAPSASLPTNTLTGATRPSATPTRSPARTPIPSASPSPQPLLPGEYIIAVQRDSETAHSYSLIALSPDGSIRQPILDNVHSFSTVSPDFHLVASLDWEGRDLAIASFLDSSRSSIPLPEPMYWASWAPDGKRLLLSSPYHVLLVDRDSGDVTPVLDCSDSSIGQYFHCGQTQWSPNGAWVAIPMTLEMDGPPDPRNGIYIADASCLDSNGDCLASAHGPYPDAIYTWSPSGDRLAICEGYDLALVRVPGWGIKRGGNCGSVYSMAWSPDGQRIALYIDGYIDLLDLHTGTVSAVTNDDLIEDVVSWINLPLP